jgi:hypothetical protein
MERGYTQKDANEASAVVAIELDGGKAIAIRRMLPTSRYKAR